MPDVIIGLSGYAQSGKDTVAGILVRQCGFQRVAFADTIRDFAMAANPLIPYWDGHFPLARVINAVGYDEAKHNPEVRRFLQDLGMAMRKISVDAWVNAAMRKVDASEQPVVITDVRFPNEVDAIRARDGFMVRIHRPGVGQVNGHVSETALDGHDMDFALVNSGTIEDLARETSDVLADIHHAMAPAAVC